ncbi:MAG TPA: YadA C-terminal domain-containing protein, partial [Rhodanobacteraceae bacterium]|nr:YadA C-terminal domain-containing protein [Rhodanobacteraceae bacterium]
QTREALQSAQTYSDAANAQTLAAANAYTNQALQGYVTTDAFSQFESQVNAHFAEVSKQIDQIGATGAAWAGMAQNTGSDDSNNVGVGFGSQGSQQALAIGYKRLLGKHASFSFGGAASGGEHSVSAGVGFHW